MHRCLFPNSGSSTLLWVVVHGDILVSFLGFSKLLWATVAATCPRTHNCLVPLHLMLLLLLLLLLLSRFSHVRLCVTP